MKIYNQILTIIILLLSSLSNLKGGANNCGSLHRNIMASPISSVEAPWTPIIVTRNHNLLIVACWGRKYIFNNNLLPAQIISQNDSLLSGPIQYSMTYNQKILNWTGATLTISKQNDTAVDLEGHSFSNNPTGNIEIISKIHIEYDGLMLISLSFSYPHQNSPGSLSISLPFKISIASYWLKMPYHENSIYSGSFPSQSGVLMEDKYNPYYWVGNNYKGLFWFCESANDWPNANKSDAIQFVKDNNTINEKFNIGPTTMFTFGIQATPVKPFPEGWRNWRISPAEGNNIVIIWPYPGKMNSVKYFAWPKAENDTAFQSLVNNYHTKGMKVLAYASVSRIPSLAPVYKRNIRRWSVGSVPMNVGTDNLMYINPNSVGFADTISHDFTKYLEKYHLDGYYLDGVDMYNYWKTDNNESYYPILAYRKLYSQLYDSIKTIDPNAIIISHMSRYMIPPILGYSDAYLDGEQFRYGINGGTQYKSAEEYLQDLTLSKFRIEFMGKQWGIVPLFLPEVSEQDSKMMQPTETLATLCLLHDVQPWATNSNLSVWNQMYNALDSFKFANCTFIPYYDSIPPAKSNIPNIYISAYQKNNGQILLIVGNLSTQTQQAILSLNMSRLNLVNIERVFSFNDKKTISFVGNKIPITISGLSYQLLWIK